MGSPPEQGTWVWAPADSPWRKPVGQPDSSGAFAPGRPPRSLELRWKALEQLLGRAREHRLSGDDEQAEGYLERFLAHRVQWGTKLNGALESSLLEEMAGTHQHCRQIIAAPAQRGLALTAEYAFGRKRALLAHPEMAPIRREMKGAVLRSGKSSCERLKKVPAENAPHWAELVARFEASPWYSEHSSRPAAFTLKGQFTTRHEREPIRLTAPWVDREPYTDYEERTETYQEPYTEEEEYTEAGQKKKRTVTKYREKTRSYTVPVTRYRDVHKSFDYHAVRHSVALRSEQLSAHWRQAYCAPPALTLNEAARCARAGAELPASARKVLSEVLDEDASRAPLLFASP